MEIRFEAKYLLHEKIITFFDAVGVLLECPEEVQRVALAGCTRNKVKIDAEVGRWSNYLCAHFPAVVV